jgi:hypothetical protein
MRKLPLLFTALILYSCDIDFGENGVVVDSENGLRVEGVTVRMKNHYKDVDDVTDSIGYFHASASQNCGFDCNDSYTITFTKPGYDTLTIDGNYYKTAEFIESSYGDTLVVKLHPLP